MATRPIRGKTDSAAAGGVDAFIASSPEDQRAVLAEIRGMIRAAMPGATETMSPNGFPVYTARDGTWLAGFASRKAAPMLYVMAPGVLDAHDASLGTLRSGRSCVRFAPSRSVDAESLRSLARAMLADAARYL